MPRHRADLLTPQLRQIESEVDNAYKRNPLVKLDLADASWNLLAFSEDNFLKPQINRQDITIHSATVTADIVLTNLDYPLHWLHSSCSSGNKVIFGYNDDKYEAAWNLMKLSERYTSFCIAFTYASRGLIQLQVEECKITAVHDFYMDSRYEAYNRLIGPATNHSLNLDEDSENELDALLEGIRQSFRVNGERFCYDLNPKNIGLSKNVVGPFLKRKFSLPDSWTFSRYSLRHFRLVFEAIMAIAFVHWSARLLAVVQDCHARGYASCLFTPTQNEFLARVTNYSGLEENIVSYIIEDLSYGSAIETRPDPVLQPLIPLAHKYYAIMPNLWLNSSAERNFTVLLNRLPSEKVIYSKLVEEKELLMKERFENSLSRHNLRLASGKIPERHDLPDIDLAVIDDTSRTCLLFELKWFIAPAEVREVMEKTEELRKGVRQLLTLKHAFDEQHPSLLHKLGIDYTYKLQLVLASENWIGHKNVQHSEVPIISAAHILAKLNECLNLPKTVEWLQYQRYLPLNNVHYEVRETVSTINGWTLNWYGIKPLVTDEFFPL